MEKYTFNYLLNTEKNVDLFINNLNYLNIQIKNRNRSFFE